LNVFSVYGIDCRGIAFALARGMKMALVSIALSALVLWALGCGGIHV
jgi:hypothetical protein